MEWVGLGSARATTNMARAKEMHPTTSLQSVLWIMGSAVHCIQTCCLDDFNEPLESKQIPRERTSVREEEGWR